MTTEICTMSTNQTEDASSLMTKIPPPPSEHPPPYTPFGGQSSSLLPQTTLNPEERSARTAARNINPRIIQPPGFQKYLHHLTCLRCIIVSLAIIAIVVFGYVIHLLNMVNESNEKVVLEGTKPLDVSWVALGEFNNTLNRLSYDENNNVIIVSEYFLNSGILHCEKVSTVGHLTGYNKFPRNVFSAYEDCICFTEDVHCCSTDSNGKHHKTDCFLTEENGETIHSVAVKYDFVSNWQSLADEEKLVFVHNRQHNGVLDLKAKRVRRIEEERLPLDYTSYGFFFPMDTAAELKQLIKTRGEFRICEYIKSLSGNYALNNQSCVKTPFTVEFELPKVKFCSNPLYTAVIQYGSLPSEEHTLTWHLRVKYDSSSIVYSAAESLDTKLNELVLDCNNKDIDIYVLGRYDLQQFSVELPNLLSEHFIQEHNK